MTEKEIVKASSFLGVLEEISKPQAYFDSNPKDLEEVVNIVRNGFGRELDFQDIYNHVTAPERVFLLRNGGIKAMASYNKKNFAGFSSLIVEGICLDPSIQGKRIFQKITDLVVDGEEFICLRTQSPRMYKALETYCKYNVFPRFHHYFPSPKEIFLPDLIKSVQEEFATYLGCNINHRGIIREYYGGLFYGKEPKHPAISSFFKKGLNMDLFKGDAVLAVGLNPNLGGFPEEISETSSGW